MARKAKTGMLTGKTDKPAMPTKDTTPPETGGIKPMRDVKGDSTPSEMTFTFFEGAERGDASPTSLYGSREAEQLTEAELRAYFEGDTVNRLPEVFGTFDNYLAYMTEREQLIQSGDYDVGNWDEYTGSLTEDELMILGGDDLTQYGDDASSTYEELFGERTQNQSAAYENWVNSEANQALLEKYGVSDTVYSETGDTFRWNGSAYVKTVDVDNAGLTDYIKTGMALLVSVVGAPALTGAFGGGFIGGASAGAVTSAMNQLIINGEIDLEDLAVAAVKAGATSFLGDYLETASTEAQNQVEQYANGKFNEYSEALIEAQESGNEILENYYNNLLEHFEPLTTAGAGDLAQQAQDVLSNTDIIMNIGETIVENAPMLDEAANIVEEINENERVSTSEDTPDIDVSTVREILEDVEPEPDTPLEEPEIEYETPAPTQEEPDPDLPIDIPPPTLPEPETEQVAEAAEAAEAEAAEAAVLEETEQVEEIVDITSDNSIEAADSELQDTTSITNEIFGDVIEAGESDAAVVDYTTAEQVAEMINTVLVNQPNVKNMTSEEVSQIVNEIIANTPQAETLTPEQIEAVAESAASNIQTTVQQDIFDVREEVSDVQTELGTSILGIQREVSEVERSLTEALEAHTIGQARELSEAEANLLSELTGVEADILQQMSVVEGGLQDGLLDLGQNINAVRTDLQSQITVGQEEAAEERRDLQQAIINVGGDIDALDEQTREQFDQFGQNVNDLFSDVNVDIEGLQEGQVSQAEAQAEFESSVAGQFEQVGGELTGIQSDITGLGQQIGGVEAGLEGLGEGIAGLGEGLGAGLLGLLTQQQQLPQQIAAAMPRQPVKYDKFLEKLTPRKMPKPLKVQGMLV